MGPIDVGIGHDYILWIAFAAVGVHLAEAHLCGILDYYKKKDLTAGAFAVKKVMWLVVVLACAMVGWAHPVFSMLVPALLILGTIKCIVGSIKHHMWMPGLLSAIVLYIPIGVALYVMGSRDGVLTYMSGFLGLLWAVLLILFPWLCCCCCHRSHHRKK
jgi:hypothetical protein